MLALDLGGLAQIGEGGCAHTLFQFVEEGEQRASAGIIAGMAHLEGREEQRQAFLVALLFAEEQPDIGQNQTLALMVLNLPGELQRL